MSSPSSLDVAKDSPCGGTPDSLRRYSIHNSNVIPPEEVRKRAPSSKQLEAEEAAAEKAAKNAQKGTKKVPNPGGKDQEKRGGKTVANGVAADSLPLQAAAQGLTPPLVQATLVPLGVDAPSVVASAAMETPVSAVKAPASANSTAVDIAPEATATVKTPVSAVNAPASASSTAVGIAPDAPATAHHAGAMEMPVSAGDAPATATAAPAEEMAPWGNLDLREDLTQWLTHRNGGDLVLSTAKLFEEFSPAVFCKLTLGDMLPALTGGTMKMVTAAQARLKVVLRKKREKSDLPGPLQKKPRSSDLEESSESVPQQETVEWKTSPTQKGNLLKTTVGTNKPKYVAQWYAPSGEAPGKRGEKERGRCLQLRWYAT